MTIILTDDQASEIRRLCDVISSDGRSGKILTILDGARRVEVVGRVLTEEERLQTSLRDNVLRWGMEGGMELYGVKK